MNRRNEILIALTVAEAVSLIAFSILFSYVFGTNGTLLDEWITPWADAAAKDPFSPAAGVIDILCTFSLVVFVFSNFVRLFYTTTAYRLIFICSAVIGIICMIISYKYAGSRAVFITTQLVGGASLIGILYSHRLITKTEEQNV